MRGKMTRRGFAKLAGATAIAVPTLAGSDAAAAQQPQATPPAEVARPKYGMTREQEERVKQAVERNERGRTQLRAFPLSYAAEPSFVFKARVKSR